MEVKGAGIIFYKVINQEKNYLIHLGDEAQIWDIGGKKDPGESDIETAVREWIEETEPAISIKFSKEKLTRFVKEKMEHIFYFKHSKYKLIISPAPKVVENMEINDEPLIIEGKEKSLNWINESQFKNGFIEKRISPRLWGKEFNEHFFPKKQKQYLFS